MYIVDWIAREVFIPVSDLILVSGTEYKLDMAAFHREIRRLEWEFTEGLWSPQILEHTIIGELAGTEYADLDKVVNDYKIIFDPLASKVVLSGSDNNIIDVLVINGVSVIPTNSRGSVKGSGITKEEMRETLIEAMKVTTC